MKLAFFDLSGTLLQYGRSKTIPLMNLVLKALKEQEWEIAVVSNWSETQCKAMLVS